ncbi:MAG: DNA translocase FtsK 4TM domain-containing protein [Actinomycetota bacterium]
MPRSKSTSTARSGPNRASERSTNRSGAAAAREAETARPDKGPGEIRRAVTGREHEFWAIAFIACGVLVGLAVYARLAGPVGRGADAALGAGIGLGRFALPVILVAIGIALLRGDHPVGRTRLTIGWGGVLVAGLGVLHVVRGPRSYTGVDALGAAGGWIGAAGGETLRTLLGPVGAILVLVALAIASALLITTLALKAILLAIRDVLTGAGSGLTRSVESQWRRATTLDESDRYDDVHRDDVDDDDSSDDAAEEWFDDAAADDLVEEPAARPADESAERPVARPVPDRAPEEGNESHVQGRLDADQSNTKAGATAWTLPPSSYLSRTGKQSIDEKEIDQRGRDLESALSSHGVEVRLVDRTVGPTVTRYELELGPGVKVARVTSLQKDIAYALAATDVRILAPIPGRSAIGIEVPNRTRQLVSLGDLLASAEAKASHHPLDVAIGKDIAGRSVFLNLATTPHLLIAGATGAGKSSGINCIITSLLMRTTPDQVRLILVDPKQVEMGQYARLPHLLTQPVTNPKKAANALAWAVKEMERRYDVLFEMGYRDITGYNAAYDRGELSVEIGSDRELERMHYIVVVVDELNDLMMVAARDVEESITRIAQKARAVGIHLVIATQRPSVNVITGVIKANVPARAAFAVSSQTDSRVILDQVGAEKLVGKGDMLLLPGNSAVAQRIQGCWVEEEEVRKVVAFWRKQAPVQYVSGVEGEEPGSASGSSITDGAITDGAADDSDDALVRRAMELVVRSGLGSTSMLQRKLGVGFARAGRIMDLLEQRGIVGPSTGSKAREVLMTVEEFEAL